MRTLMLLIWYSVCAVAGAAVTVLGGLSLKYLSSDEYGRFNLPLIYVLAAVALSPLVFLAIVRIFGRGRS